jgi:hypothetical protein
MASTPCCCSPRSKRVRRAGTEAKTEEEEKRRISLFSVVE